MSSVALGVVLGLAGSIAINTGNNIQSLGMQQLEIDSDDEIHICSSRTWVLGTFVFVTGALLNFASYGFAPQSTLASLESIQFVTNLFFSKVLLKKDISPKMYAGTILTVSGTVFAVMFSSKEAAPIEDIADLVLLWENYLWIGYLFFLLILAGVLQLVYRYWEKREEKTEGCENAMAAIYALVSALWGTLSVVFAKLLAVLLELEGSGENISIFSHWFMWTTLLCWLVLMSFWLYRLNSALSLYNPLFIIPLLQANFIFFAIISGGIYFQEFNYMKDFQWAGFSFGVCCMFLGIFLLVPEKLVVVEPEQKIQTPESLIPTKEFSLVLSPKKAKTHRRVSAIFTTGAGKLNQRAFDIRAQTTRLQRLRGKSNLSSLEEEHIAIFEKIMGTNIAREQSPQYEKLQEISADLDATGQWRRVLTLGNVNTQSNTQTPRSWKQLVRAKEVLSELSYDWTNRTLNGKLALAKMWSEELQSTNECQLTEMETNTNRCFPLGEVSTIEEGTTIRGFGSPKEATADFRMLSSTCWTERSGDLEESSIATSRDQTSASLKFQNPSEYGIAGFRSYKI